MEGYRHPTSGGFREDPGQPNQSRDMFHHVSNSYNYPPTEFQSGPNTYNYPSAEFESVPQAEYMNMYRSYYTNPPPQRFSHPPPSTSSAIQGNPPGPRTQPPSNYAFNPSNGVPWQQISAFPMVPYPIVRMPKQESTQDSSQFTEPSNAVPIASTSPGRIETDSETTLVDEDLKKTTKKPVIMVGKRRGGKVLPTGNLGVSKKPRTENEKGRSDAWSRYMAEVKRYKERSCEEDRKNRPLVKVNHSSSHSNTNPNHQK